MRPAPLICQAVDCKAPRKQGQLMCKHHWFMVPPALRKEVWNTWRALCGGHGSRVRYMGARKAAIDSVALQEGHTTIEEVEE